MGSELIRGNKNANRLYGRHDNDTIYGMEGNDWLFGDEGNDILDGGTGADTMLGGYDNDIYIVDNVGDVVTEYAGQGMDEVRSSISYTLTANVERLRLTGTAALNGTGNALANTLTGNSADNVLDGGAGNDTLIGGAGNDTYVANSSSDNVVESIDQGTDTVLASSTYALYANIENLTLTGTEASSGIGNALNNVIVGNASANTLSGNTGNDTLVGGGGNDTLLGGEGSDTYLFGAGDGHDVVQEIWAPGMDVDTLRLNAGITPDQVTLVRRDADLLVRLASGDEVRVAGQYMGNGIEKIQFDSGLVWGAYEFDQATTELIGTAGDDFLIGRGSADVLQGLGGNDVLVGDYGSDTYLFGAGDGHDVVQEIWAPGMDVDTLRLNAGITPDQVTLVRRDADLLVRLASGDEVRVAGQYMGNGIEKIQFENGPVWSAYEIDTAPIEIIVTLTGVDTTSGDALMLA